MSETPEIPESDRRQLEAEQDAAYWRLYRFLIAMTKFWGRPKAQGNPFAMETDGPVIIASNHAGHLWWDMLNLLACFPKRKMHMAAHYWDASVLPLRMIIDEVGSTYIRENPEDIIATDGPVSFLNDGKAIVIYPEESYHSFKHRYTVFRFAPHVARYAELSGAPIVPVAMIGVEEAAPCLFGLKRPGVPLHISPMSLILPLSITAEFGDPVTYPELIKDAPVGLSPPALWQYGADQLQARMVTLIAKHRPTRAKASDRRYIEHAGWV